MRKRFVGFILAVAMCLVLGTSGMALAASTSEAQAETISLNGKQIDSIAISRNGILYLPVRILCESLGYTVQWVSSDGRRTVVTALQDETVTLDLTNQTITRNGTTVPITGSEAGDGCVLENDRTYLESALFAAAYGVAVEADEQSGTAAVDSLLDPDAVNNLRVGDIACVMLSGNPTTGYEWHVTIGDEEILAKTGENYVSDSDSSQLVGAGGTYIWTFKALKKGETTITFRYYRSWLGEDSATAEDTITYRILVS